MAIPDTDSTGRKPAPKRPSKTTSGPTPDLRGGAKVEGADDALLDHHYLDDKAFQAINELLQRNVAGSISLYLKSKKFHWDVRGRFFREMHKLLDKSAAVALSAVDPLAERLVQLGGSPIAAPSQIEQLGAAKVPTDTVHDPRPILESLVGDYDKITTAMRDDSDRANDLGDPATSDLLNAILLELDKVRWMLRATLDDRMLD